MTKHGASHGIAVLTCTLAAGLLVDLVKKYVPAVHAFLRELAAIAASHVPLGYSADFITVMLYATALATAWGVAFALVHND